MGFRFACASLVLTALARSASLVSPEPEAALVPRRSLASGETRLDLNSANSTVFGSVRPGGWNDYYVDADDDDANIYFEVIARTKRPDALGVYVFEERLRPHEERLNPGAYLDYDTSSMVVQNGERKYTVVVGQCYVQKGTRYFLAINGVADSETTHYSVTAVKVPAALPLNGAVRGSLCDSRYLHFFWEVAASPGVGGGVKTTLTKSAGELDSFYVRYERCAGPIGSNLERLNVEGHGVPSRSLVLPRRGEELLAGRYYISVKGKMEMCGDFEISTQLLDQQQLEASPAAARSGSAGLGGWALSLLGTFGLHLQMRARRRD